MVLSGRGCHVTKNKYHFIGSSCLQAKGFSLSVKSVDLFS